MQLLKTIKFKMHLTDNYIAVKVKFHNIYVADRKYELREMGIFKYRYASKIYLLFFFNIETL